VKANLCAIIISRVGDVSSSTKFSKSLFAALIEGKKHVLRRTFSLSDLEHLHRCSVCDAALKSLDEVYSSHMQWIQSGVNPSSDCKVNRLTKIPWLFIPIFFFSWLFYSFWSCPQEHANFFLVYNATLLQTFWHFL
jgi:hypothetical protein